jgi:uncharacterized protein (DUF1800 family)
MSNVHGSSDDVVFVINRLGYGPRAQEYSALQKLGVDGWLEDQLASPAEDHPIVKDRIAECKLRVKYDAAEGKWPAVDEMRPLSSLSQPIDQLWMPLFEPDKQINGQERGRPRLEVIAATMIRAVYSPYQLREVMTQFWHDHFHVNAFSDDHIAVALPTYDRDVIRKNCFGNFRTMLEAVATSTAMQYYLSNHSSRAGSANENYARELFELHSFGRENYLNDHYDRWHDVPGALQGHPAGYIDQDVYEAARAFTGWTVEDGSNVDNGRKLPSTGQFVYVENWHDGYQKRVLATEFDPFAKPMADGRKVLDLIASHPGTARHMATKLCVRLVGPNPPSSLIERISEAWQKTVDAPDQIVQMVRLIVQSSEFMQSRGVKIKRPLALMASYVRIMGYDFTPSEGLFNQLSNSGQRLYGWPMPTGLPDDNSLFLGSNAMRNRWNLMLGLAQNAWGNGAPDATKTMETWGGKIGSGSETVAEWFRLFGTNNDDKLIETTLVASGILPFAPLGGNDNSHLAMASAIAAMSPEFQMC